MKNLAKLKILNIFLGIALAGAGFLTFSTQVNAQVPTTDKSFGQCIGEALAAYMNALIAAKGSGQIPDNIKLLSPALNMTSSTLPEIVNGMKQGGANFGALHGISGNVYNVGGQRISYYMENVRELFPGARFYITETGTFDRTDQGVIDLAEELQNIGGDVEGMLLFNALGTNGGWDKHKFTPEQIQYICGGDCRGKKIGINTANMFGISNDGYYQQAGNSEGSLNVPYSLEIADSASYANVVKGIQNSINNGITPIIRIGVGDSSLGFNDASTYAAFLGQIGRDFPGIEILAIAGPNEPDLESWLSPACYALVRQTGQMCGGLLDFEPVSYRGEVIGISSGGPPWQLSAALSNTSGDDDIDTIADKLTAKLIIQTTATYAHPDLDGITNNIVGQPGSINTLVKNRDEPFHVRSQIKNVKFPGSFTVPTQQPKDATGFGEESFEDWTKRLFTTTTEAGGIKFGTRSEMPATNFIGCLQRPVCDPNIDTCLRNSNGKELCNPGDDPETCVGVGRLFTFNGQIDHEEPAALQAIVRSRYDAKTLLLMPSKSQRTERTANRFEDEFIYEEFAKANALSGYGLAEAPEAISDVIENQGDLAANTAQPNPITSIVNPPPAKAQGEEGWVNNYLSLSATQNDGSTYNISYRYCVAHASPCGMRDVSSKINGQEINIWARSSTPDGTCLEPGWGGAPMFVGVSLPFTVSASSRGGWQGPDYCRAYDTVSASCTISEDPVTGALVSTCGAVPEPLPLDCRDCPSWAPANLCQPIIAPSVLDENRCANGQCETGDASTIEDIDYPGENLKVEFDFSWSEWLTNLLGFYSVGCETIESTDPITGEEEFERLQCLFNNKDYLMYAYASSGFWGDLEQYRSQDLEIHNALYKIQGRTDRYFDEFISSKHQVGLRLTFDENSVAARGGDEDPFDFPFLSGSPDDDAPLDADYVHLGIQDNGIRTMNIEYYELFQPQLSGFCMGIAFENFKGEFDESLMKYCDQYDFVPQGIKVANRNTDLPPATPTEPAPIYTGTIESALQTAGSANGVPIELMRTILEMEAGPGYTETSVCKRNSSTATGPFQIIDSTALSLVNSTERTNWNIQSWGSDQDYSEDGRCQINIAAELAARLLRRNVGGVDISASNKDQVVRAAEGYYGSCNPDQYTDIAYGINIGYCDYAVFRMGLCAELSPDCDGKPSGTIADAGSVVENLAKAVQADKVLQQNLASNMTDQDKMELRMTLLGDVERIINENKAEIQKNNGKIPPAAQTEITASLMELTMKYKSKYNL